MSNQYPKEVAEIADKLSKAGFEAYLVGGCVRDMLLDREPKDWDIATNAKPNEVQEIFKDSVYENDFGTVGVKTDSENPKLKVIEVTTFRIEGKYTDKRHPDEIKFAKTIEEDLSRRDFTINAMAFKMPTDSSGLSVVSHQSIVDPFGGEKDLKKQIIRTVGDPEERFSEDALRLLRAVRFAVELGLEIDFDTRRAIEKLSGLLEAIAKERIRDEFVKMIMSDGASRGIYLLEELNLLRSVLPDLREGIGVGQNKHHIYTVFEHNVRALDYSVKQNYSLVVRLASLLHDVGKTRSKKGDGPDSTFYNHEVIGAKMTIRIMDRLRFSKDIAEKVTHLVRNHLFYYNVGEVTASGVRRFLRRVGPENIDDLIKVREADRIGSGVPKAVPYKLRHLLFMIEKVKNDPLSPKMLNVTGVDVMKILEIEPGPKVGQILNILLEQVLDDPKLNSREHLESEIKKLGKLSDKKLQAMTEEAKEKKDKVEQGIEEDIKKKYYVK